MGNFSPHTPFLCYSLRKERHKKTMGFSKTSLMQLWSKGSVMGDQMCGETVPLMTKPRQQKDFAKAGWVFQEAFQFLCWHPLHVSIPGGQVHILWKQAQGRTYLNCAWFLLSFVLVIWKKRK